MADLQALRALCTTPSAAVRWACILEATAPKAGNVSPGQSFDDLTYTDFLIAAEIAADTFGSSDRSPCRRAREAAERTFAQTKTNVNLGILLLLTPLVGANELAGDIAKLSDWPRHIRSFLGSLSANDSESLFAAIQVSNAGGLGEVDEMDVNQTSLPTGDIVTAMRLGADRDRIAHQYANSFSDLITNVVPVVEQSIHDASDLLTGIADAQIRLLSTEIDTLIARKCGAELARTVQQHAAKVDLTDQSSRQQFDAYLRSQSNRLNPGTTADLIAAAIYVLLRTESTLHPNQ